MPEISATYGDLAIFAMLAAIAGINVLITALLLLIFRQMRRNS